MDLLVADEADLEFLLRLINDPDVWRSLFLATPKTMDDERTYYEEVVSGDDGETHLLICEEGNPVGTIGLGDVEPNWGIAELGYLVDLEVSGNGYATEAAGLLVGYAFEHRRIEKVYAHVLASNRASQRVLEKNGFVEEGRFRREAFVDGEREDVLRYGLLADEHGS